MLYITRQQAMHVQRDIVLEKSVRLSIRPTPVCV